MAAPANAKRDGSSLDALSRTLYGKRDAASEHVFPILVTTDGTLRVTVHDYDGQILQDPVARTDGQPVYKGMGATSLPTGSTGWIIYKYEYGTGALTFFMLSRKTAHGAWSDRGSLTYA